MITWKDLLSNPSVDPYIRSIEPGECALYLHSGGTMGNPKTIMLSSLNMNTLALQGPLYRRHQGACRVLHGDDPPAVSRFRPLHGNAHHDGQRHHRHPGPPSFQPKAWSNC